MRMQKRKLRCFAEGSDDLWIAYCLDFGLGAQGDSFEEAKKKLEVQIRDLSPAEATLLLERNSPNWLWARYWLTWAFSQVAHWFGKVPRRRMGFTETMPPALVAC